MKDLTLSIFNILRYAGRFITIFRNFILNTFLLVLLVIIFVSIVVKDKPSIENNSALLLKISGNIVEEKKIADPVNELFNESLGFSRLPGETLLQDIIDAINAAAYDKKINSIVLDLSTLGLSTFNQIEDIGAALDNFKSTGKRVIAAEDYYTQNKYLLASFADKIFLNPEGLVDLHGLGTYRLFYKDALEKLKINYHVFRVGEYKSALETVTRNSMSEEARSQNSVWLNALWGIYKNVLNERRDVSLETIDQYTNNISTLLEEYEGDAAELALNINLVDELKTREELRSYLVGMTAASPGRGFRYVSFKEYLKTFRHSYLENNSSKRKIGIIIAQGNIIPGEQPQGMIGSDSLIKLIRKAREDHNIRAVVLRINTGGGSVFASEAIRDELQYLRKEGKPLVVSMGSVAASGGYWISAEADEIWAHPTTLTGSIGIFGAVPTFENSLSELGVYSDGIGTTDLAAGINLTQPLQPELEDAVQLNIERVYKKFLNIVSEGRQLKDEKLNVVAEGRVFDGLTAQSLGLVDNLGNLKDAIQSAANLAHLDNYSALYIKSTSSFSERILLQLHSSLRNFNADWGIPEIFVKRLQFIRESASSMLLFNDPKGIYAHCMIHYF